jgi:hypothetical protein
LQPEGFDVEELIKALANDVKVVDARRAGMAPFSSAGSDLYGKSYGFKVALGRAILADNGMDVTNINRAIILADDYLLHN